jgi:hypothetical protein
LFDESTSRISIEATKFLEKKGTIEKMENHSLIRIFCAKENPSFLQYCVSDKLFIVKVANQYNLWLHFFHEKRKKQFIPLPYKIGEYVLRNINKIDEFVGHFVNFSLRYTENIKGFDPRKIFVEHNQLVGFNNSFIQTVLNEDEEIDSQNTPPHDIVDLETLLSNKDYYKQKRKNSGEMSAQYPVVTPKKYYIQE